MNKDLKQIIGSGGGGKSGGSSHVATEDPDSLISVQYARIIDMIGEGEISGLVDGLKSVYINDTPIQNADNTLNFEGVTISFRNGTQIQDHIPGFPSVEAESAVNVEVKQAVPVVRQVTDSNLDYLRVTLGVPRLTKQDKSTGDITGYLVEYAIDLQANGGGYVEVFAGSFDGKTTTRFQRSHDIELTGSPPWDIRVRRITDEATDSAIIDKFYWESYTEVIDEKFSYPNSALAGLQIDASQFSSVPTRGYECKLLKVKIPNGYDPILRTYPGTWDGTFTVAWTDNPAWCFYDLITNDRYGLGSFVDDTLLDKWSLYEISQYCDALVDDGFGGQEPRFTCNMYLQTRAEALSVVRNFASVFRSMVYWSTNGIITVQDSPEYPKAQFTNADILDGMFSYQGSASKVRHTVALVSWNDPDDAYKQKIEYVEDQDAVIRYGYNETEIIAFGCTSRGQAHRVGKWLLYTENNEKEVISFTTALEGTSIYPGMVVKTLDSDRAGIRHGGRLTTGSTTTALNIDSGIDIEAGKTYTVTVVMPDGTMETKSLTNNLGTGHTVLELDSALSAIPLDYAIWVITSTDVSPELWRVLAVSEGKGNQYTITGLEHNPSKYDFVESDIVLKTPPTTIVSNTQSPVSVINVVESLYQISNETFSTKINVDWEAPDGAVNYKFMYKKDNNNYVTIMTRETSVEILNAGFGSYKFIIVAYNPLGVPSANFTHTADILGVTAPPEDVTGFSVSVINALAVFTWNAVSDLDLKHYEIREGTTWATGAFVGQTKGLSFTDSTVTTGSHDYMIRAMDYYGNYSALDGTATLTVSPPTLAALEATYNKDLVTISWSSTIGSFPIEEYELKRDGTSWADAIAIADLEGNSYSESASWTSRTYRVKARDSAGNYSSEQTIVISITAPTVDTFTASYSGGTLILNWSATPGTIDIKNYEIRYGGAGWGDATSLGFVTGNEMAVPVSWDNRTFRIKAFAYNNANNESSEVTVASNITKPVIDSSSYIFVSSTLQLSWSSTAGTVPIEEYEIRKGGTGWGDATFVAKVYGNNYTENVSAQTWVDTTYRIKAIDVAGNESTLSSDNAITITAPSAPVISEAFDESKLILSWTATANTLPITGYEVRYGGADWASAAVLGIYDVDSLSTVVEWSSRIYRVKAIDIAGFYSAEGSKTVTISPPTLASLTAEIVDNNALLRWTVTNGTLPYQQAEIRRGDVYASATIIGVKSGTFTVLFEQVGGTFTYWVTPIDTAGNYGTPVSKTVVINQPPDYVLRANWDSDLTGGTSSNFKIASNGAGVLPIDIAETWQQHFVNNTWNTPQDQIDAGYPYYIQPTLSSGHYEEIFDYGAQLPSTKITATLTSVATGTLTVTPTISVSDTSATGPWTDYPGVDQVLATGFRWVKVRYDVTQVGDDAFLEITNLNLRLDVKLRNDAGSGTGNSGDSGGTTVNFNVTFVDVESIIVTPLSTTAVIPVVNFVDAPYPTSFKVLLFDTDGVRVTEDFSWTARGY